MEQFFGFKDILDFGLYSRGLLVTLYAVIIFRMNLSRLYGNHSPLDFIIFIILGAILGEAIVNNIPLLPSIIVSTLIIFMYRFFAFVSFKSHKIGKFLKGEKIIIVQDGKYLLSNLQKARLTNNDILQALRIQYGISSIQTVKKAILERSGEISFQMNPKSEKGLTHS
ncbi:MAG: DUF421 domain-containing protein [Tatlockia sp.]|nr:DUF421 domain-containing protein [Tatlockia sp.]